MPTGRSSVAFAEYRGLLVIAGGECTEAGEIHCDVEVYDLRDGSRLSFPELPAPRHALAAATADDKLFFFGGSASCSGAGKVAESLVLELP